LEEQPVTETAGRAEGGAAPDAGGDPLQEPAGWAVAAPQSALPETPAGAAAAPDQPAPGPVAGTPAARPTGEPSMQAPADGNTAAASAAPTAAPEPSAAHSLTPDPVTADARAALRLQRAVDAQLDRVVQLGRELVNTRLFGATGQAVELREAQLRNAVAVANETDSVEVLKNWVYYQVARPEGRGWRQGAFAEGLVAQIDGDLDRLAATAARGAGMPERQRDAHLRLTRLYLGYLSRHFAYRQQERERATPGATGPAAAAARGPSGTAPAAAGGRAPGRAARPTPPRPSAGPAATPPERPAPADRPAPPAPAVEAAPPAGEAAGGAPPPAEPPPPTAEAPTGEGPAEPSAGAPALTSHPSAAPSETASPSGAAVGETHSRPDGEAAPPRSAAAESPPPAPGEPTESPS